MNEPRTCPNCRSAVPVDAPAGACPACALRAGFDAAAGTEYPTRTASPRRIPPLPAEDLARRLPELEHFELIGQGGMGAVYRARHRGLDRAVAVKVLSPDLGDDASFAERFTREARTMAALDHSNIVAVHDFGERDGLYYLIMEFVDGVNLRQTIEAGGLSSDQALAMVPRICEALQYAHDQGVVHRDIKPENILVDRGGNIKIADFGLAKLVRGKDEHRLTRTAQVMGTPHYMAPEQIEHPGDVDHRADIYALGVVFYELLTGELPVGRFPPPSSRVAIDVRLDEVVLRTLEKEPDLRYQRASELQSEVESISSGDYVTKKSGKGGYEYRSSRTLFGLPLVHIAFSGDSTGRKMRLASGIIAIGDIAIGGVAVGGFSFGGITFGGINLGLFAFGGVAFGLLTCLSGVAIGGFAVGGVAIGLIARGAVAVGQFTGGDPGMAGWTLLAWFVMTAGLTLGAIGVVYAWLQAVRAGQPRGG